jgi:hypothetical protein
MPLITGQAAAAAQTDVAAQTLQSAATGTGNGSTITLDAKSQSVLLSASGGIATIIAEWSFDAGATWETAFYTLVLTGAPAAAITVAAGVTRYTLIVPPGASRFRARISAFVSGNITATAIERRLA